MGWKVSAVSHCNLEAEIFMLQARAVYFAAIPVQRVQHLALLGCHMLGYHACWFIIHPLQAVSVSTLSSLSACCIGQHLTRSPTCPFNLNLSPLLSPYHICG